MHPTWLVLWWRYSEGQSIEHIVRSSTQGICVFKYVDDLSRLLYFFSEASLMAETVMEKKVGTEG
jgi:hypothetical protein